MPNNHFVKKICELCIMGLPLSILRKKGPSHQNLCDYYLLKLMYTLLGICGVGPQYSKLY